MKNETSKPSEAQLVAFFTSAFVAGFVLISTCLAPQAALASVKPSTMGRFQKAPASDFALPVPAKYGSFSHPVIFAASAVGFKEVATTSTESDSYFEVRQNIVVQWGTSVFEIVRLAYTCDLSKTSCELEDGERLATYKSCEVADVKVACKGLISAAANTSENNSAANFEETYETENTSHGEDFPDRTTPNNFGGLAP